MFLLVELWSFIEAIGGCVQVGVVFPEQLAGYYFGIDMRSIVKSGHHNNYCAMHIKLNGRLN